jgi:glycosyltransferase involved in cell wall biosynthesis
MRVLWLCNIMLPAFARMAGLPFSNREGWLTGSFEKLIHEREQEGSPELLVELGVCCPVPAELGECHRVMDVASGKEVTDSDGGAQGTVDFYGFQENLNTPEIYDRDLEDRFFAIIREFRPDIVHIFGTEFPHCLAMVRAFHHPERTLIGIQGLCCSIAEAYMADLPYSVQRRATFRDWYRKDSLEEQRHKFRMRANMEAQALRHTAHITGRTSFDRSMTSRINDDAVYHSMNETMRPDFYTDEWNIDNVEPYSIFISQGDYPLKGFHYMLEAMPAVLDKFPEAHLYVAGNSIIGDVGGAITKKRKYPEPLWITSYGMYLKKLIRRNHLKGHVTMLGKLDAAGMKERFLRSHVFVCPSIMENSPNSLCEAMLLGMPVVAAKVGGIGDLVIDGEEGILFPGGKYDELAEGIKTVFYDDNVADWLGGNARIRAQIRHNPDTNFRRLLEIYRSIAQ